MTAIDSGGLSTSVTIELYPRTVTLSLATLPTGLPIGAGPAAEVTPFARTLAVGTIVSVSASSPQTLDGRQYAFTGWSDGGAALHDVVIGETDLTLTASFTRTCAATPDCDDADACTDEACENGLCAVTARACVPADECHEGGTCDPATGACVVPQLGRNGVDCLLRATLDGSCAGTAIPRRLRRGMEHHLARARALLVTAASSTGRRAAQRGRLPCSGHRSCRRPGARRHRRRRRAARCTLQELLAALGQVRIH